jgi:hypothetical protein
MKLRLLFNGLLCFAVSSTLLGDRIDIASANSRKYPYCFGFPMPQKGSLYSRDGSDRVNIRQQPNIRSKIIYVGSSKTSVSMHKEVLGNNNFCWFFVRVNNSKITGWVRADLLDFYLD